MISFDAFSSKLTEYLTNNVTALMGTIQLTSNERDELMQMFSQLSAEDKKQAEALMKTKGLDASQWK
jgi:hypothetical protein